jgi:hypothetical protein
VTSTLRPSSLHLPDDMSQLSFEPALDFPPCRTAPGFIPLAAGYSGGLPSLCGPTSRQATL